MNIAAGNDFSMLNRMYRKALLPNIFVILGGTVNVFFDGILVGQKIGELGVAAVNQSLAVYLILCTIGSLISAGAMAESSRALGKNDQEQASRFFSIAVELSVIIGIVIAVIGIFVSGPLAALLGTEATMSLVTDYVRITLIGGIFKILVYIPGFFLRLEGKYKGATFLTIIMMVSNILLDYIFLFIFDYGIKGAAFASVLSSAIACGFGFYFQLHNGVKAVGAEKKSSSSNGDSTSTAGRDKTGSDSNADSTNAVNVGLDNNVNSDGSAASSINIPGNDHNNSHQVRNKTWNRGMFRLKLTPIKGSEIAVIVKSGSPMASNNLLSAIRLIVLNAIMAAAGGSQYLVVFAIANNLNEFSICIQNGVPQTGSTMLGLLYGEKDSTSMRFLFRSQVKYGTIYSAGFAAILCALSGVIGRLFGCDDNIVVPVICLAISIIPATFNSGMTYYYYAADSVIMANIINALRVFVLPCGLALLFYKISVLIWLFFPLGELLTIAVWALICKINASVHVNSGHVVEQQDISAKANSNEEASSKKDSETTTSKRTEKSMFLFLENADPEKEISFTVPCDNALICSASEQISTFAEEHEFTMKQCSTLGLAVEELLVIISEKSLNKQGEISVRLLKTDDGGILRIRSDGHPYNPLDVMYDDEDMEYMGVRMICKMARKVDYQSTLGVNTLLVVI